MGVVEAPIAAREVVVHIEAVKDNVDEVVVEIEEVVVGIDAVGIKINAAVAVVINIATTMAVIGKTTVEPILPKVTAVVANYR